MLGKLREKQVVVATSYHLLHRADTGQSFVFREKFKAPTVVLFLRLQNVESVVFELICSKILLNLDICLL